MTRPFHFRLSAFGFRLPAFGFWLSAFGLWLLFLLAPVPIEGRILNAAYLSAEAGSPLGNCCWSDRS
jgi:hypothetical protein